MAKIVRPLRFDNVRKAARNAKRRARDRARREKELRRYRFFNNLFWLDIEPQVMWDNSGWNGEGANDNRPRR